MTRIDRDALVAITPFAQDAYRQAFERESQLGEFGILDSRLRLEHFLAQALHETGGLRVLIENLNYSAERLTVVWPTRFRTLADAQPFAHNPRALANRVYGNRMGNVEPGDGWRFVGRGLLQLTGRSSYARVGKAIGVDLVDDPAAVLDPDVALRVAGEEWRASFCNDAADRDDVEQVTRRINGGVIGLAERRGWLARLRAKGVVVEEGGA